MMRLIKVLLLFLCLTWIPSLQAQDDLTPYEIALQHIEEAAETRNWIPVSYGKY